MDSEWALNPVVRRDVAVEELLTALGGKVFPERRKLLVDLLDIDENWHMHAVSDGPSPSPSILSHFSFPPLPLLPPTPYSF